MAIRVVPLTAAALLVFGAVTPALAQSDVSRPFQSLGSRVRPGDTVTVQGETIGEVHGRVISVTAEALTVTGDTGPRTIAGVDVDRIERRRKGVLLGALIGLGAGAAAAIPLNSWFHNEGNDATAETLAVIGIGTGVGLGIDALVDLPRTVYVRERRIGIRVEPRVLMSGGAVSLHVAF